MKKKNQGHITAEVYSSLVDKIINTERPNTFECSSFAKKWFIQLNKDLENEMKKGEKNGITS